MEESLEQSKDLSTLNADLAVAKNSAAETPAHRMSQKVKGSAANVEPAKDIEDEEIKDEVDEDNYEDEGFEEDADKKSGGIEDFYGTDWQKGIQGDAE
jgi:hypothetical protein